MTTAAIKDYQKPLIGFTLVFCAWLFLVFNSFWSAVDIWIGNEIYNHCLIVVPAAVYLIYEKRFEIDWSQARMSWLALVIFIGQLLFFILGSAADIQLFQHVAVFSMLPTLFWLFAGNKIAWQLKFPLAFVLFAVPFGEELVPFLQEITADMSVFLLQITGIPLFRSGLFIEIPQGKFLVAEACSGVSFLIASIVLGSLYAYMNLISWKRRVFFVCLSIAFPIVANALRVYGIIYIGYSSDMKHAVGADHLIYGWFFFAFVLVCLFILGELIRRNESKKLAALKASNPSLEPSGNTDEKRLTVLSKHAIVPSIFIVLIVSIGLTKYQDYRMQPSGEFEVREMVFNDIGLNESRHMHRIAWEPRFVGSTTEEKFHLTDGDLEFDLYYAYFNGERGEIVSSLNRMYEQDRWTLVERKQTLVNQMPVNKHLITTSVGIQKMLAYWYVVDGEVAGSFIDVKLLQLFQKLKGRQSHSYIAMIAVETNPGELFDDESLNVLIADFKEQQRLRLE